MFAAGKCLQSLFPLLRDAACTYLYFVSTSWASTLKGSVETECDAIIERSGLWDALQAAE